jgi:hypothetical protein
MRHIAFAFFLSIRLRVLHIMFSQYAVMNCLGIALMPPLHASRHVSTKSKRDFSSRPALQHAKHRRSETHRPAVTTIGYCCPQLANHSLAKPRACACTRAWRSCAGRSAREQRMHRVWEGHGLVADVPHGRCDPALCRRRRQRRPHARHLGRHECWRLRLHGRCALDRCMSRSSLEVYDARAHGMPMAAPLLGACSW